MLTAPPHPEDAELLRAARRGERAAFGELVTRYADRVRIYLAVRLNDPHETEDLAQEVFVTAWKRLETFQPEAPFGPWLRGIALNLLRNHWRKHRAQPVGGSEELELLLRPSAEEPGLLDRAEGVLEALQLCLTRLDQDSRALLRWRYEEGRDILALSRELKVGSSTITMRLHRLRTGLRACILRRLHLSPP